MVLWRKFLYCEWQPKKKKRTDEPKTLWQSTGFTGFSSLKQHRLSRHAGGEQIWSSAWWSDYHKLPILIFFFLLVFLLLFAINISAFDIQSLSFLLQRCFLAFFVQCGINVLSYNLQRNSIKPASQAVSLWKNTESNINNTTVCPIYFILWQHRKFITEELSVSVETGFQL